MDEKYANRQYAERVIDETRQYWQKLVDGQTKVDDKVVSIANATLKNAATVNQDDVNVLVESSETYTERPADIDASVHQLVYVRDDNDQRTAREKNF
jgi:hypothetical protein